MVQRIERPPTGDAGPTGGNGHTPAGDAGGGGEPPVDDPMVDVDLDDGDGDGDGDEGRPSWWRRALAAVTPQGALQALAGVVALCFLAGAVGYLVGTRNQIESSAVDTGFLVDMSTHHDQAISMALCAVDKATDPVVRSFARELLVFQNRQLGTMGVWLDQRRTPRPDDPDHPAMEWMGMPTTAQSMPGMATEAEVEGLCRATGAEVDRLFLTLLRDHHDGGVHMAEYAGEHAVSPMIADFARTMARNQSVEVREYTAALRRLGFEG